MVKAISSPNWTTTKSHPKLGKIWAGNRPNLFSKKFQKSVDICRDL